MIRFFKDFLNRHTNLFLYTFLFIVLWDTRGISFSTNGLPWSSIFIIVCLFLAIKDFFSTYKNSINFDLKYIYIVISLQLLLFLLGFFIPDRELFMFTKVVSCKYLFNFILISSSILTFFYLKYSSNSLYLLLMFTLILLLFSSIYISINTATDTHLFLEIASDYINSFKNPYSFTYPDLYNGKYLLTYGDTFYFNYWPTCLYFTSICKFIFGDVRYSFVVFHIIAALFLFKFKNNQFTKSISILWLTNMIAISNSERSLIDGFVPTFLVIAVYLIYKNKLLAAGFIFGVLGSVKLYYVFLLPFIAIYFFHLKNYKSVFFIGIGFLLPILPFAIISPNQFYLSTIKFISNTSIRIDSISLVSSLKRVYNLDFASLGTIVTLLYLALAYIYVWIYKQKLINTLKLINISFLIIFLLGKQAFCNYFYFNMFLFLFIYFIQINHLNFQNE